MNNNTTDDNVGLVGDQFRLDECSRVILPDDVQLPPDHPIRFLEGASYPFFFIFGTLGNVLNLLVLRGNKHKSPADVFVMSMAVADLCIMWLFIPIWIKKIDPTLILSNVGFQRFDKVYRGIYQWLIITLYFISDWITITFSCERLLVTANPMKLLGRFTGKSAKTAVALIVFVGAIKPTEFVVDYFSWVASDQPMNRWPSLRPNWLTEWKFVHETFLVTDRVVGFTTLLTINIILTFYLYKSQQKCGSGNLAEVRAHFDNSYHGTTILSRGCAIQCLLFKFPCFTYNALLLASRPPLCSYVFRNQDKELWLAFVSFFLMINYSINFYLYFAVSKKLRQKLEARFPRLVRLVRHIFSRKEAVNLQYICGVQGQKRESAVSFLNASIA